MSELPSARDQPPVCDYEGSDYRTRFWQGQGRGYEDRAERIALRRLLPPNGDTLLDVGAGYGRLADEYAGYKTVVLFDYSRSLLREAQARLAGDERFVFVAGNWYAMPFVDGLFATLVQVRTIHHAADVSALLAQLGRVIRPKGDYVLEFANKRNLKAMLRHAFGRQAWSPYMPEPVEFAALNFDFHPEWIKHQLQMVGFQPGRRLAVSYLRLGWLKRLLPAAWLAAADAALQGTGRWRPLSPSVFVHSRAPAGGVTAAPGRFFACPHCATPLGEPEDGLLICSGADCGGRWRLEDGLYDFKEPA